MSRDNYVGTNKEGERHSVSGTPTNTQTHTLHHIAYFQNFPENCIKCKNSKYDVIDSHNESSKYRKDLWNQSRPTK